MRTLPLFIIALLMSLPLLSQAQTLHIVTSIKPLALIASDIAAEDASVEYLVPNAGSIHHYSMRVSDRVKVDQADVILLVGAGLEPFVNKMQNLSAKVLILAEQEGVVGLVGEHDDHDETEHPTENHTDASNVDPHLWLGPRNAAIVATVLAKKLGELRPEQRQIYAQRAEAFSAQIEKNLQGFTAEKPFTYFAYHNAFNYLFAALGLDMAGSLTESNENGLGLRSLFTVKQHIENSSNACILAPANNIDKVRKQFGNKNAMVAIDMLADHQHYDSFNHYLAAMIRAIQHCQ